MFARPLRLPALLLMGGLLAAAPLKAQTIRGALADPDGRPVAGTTLLLLDAQGTVLGRAVSDAEGRFFLQAPGAGSYVLRAQRTGYDPVDSPPIALAAGETRSLHIESDPAPAPSAGDSVQPFRLDPVQAQAARSGFQERVRGHGSGTILTRADIERIRPGRTLDIFRHVPGMEVAQGTVRLSGRPELTNRGMSLGRRPAAADTTRGLPGTGGSSSPSPSNPENPGQATSWDYGDGHSNGCAPAVWVDGLRWDSDGGGLANIHPEDIDGIEVYARSSMAPVQYVSTRDKCGVILIWLRPGTM
jgi:hypothetical protein